MLELLYIWAKMIINSVSVIEIFDTKKQTLVHNAHYYSTKLIVTGRQADRQTDRQAGRQTEGQKKRRNRQTEGQEQQANYSYTFKQAYGRTDK